MTETEQIKDFERLAVHMARKHSYRFPQLTFQECRQAAMVGVFYAVRSKQRRSKRALTSYVYNCVRNYLFEELRQHCVFYFTTEFKYGLQFLPIPDDGYGLPPVEDEETKASEENTISKLFKLADTLPESNYEVFRMYYKEGYTDKEIANRTGSIHSTIKSKRRRSVLAVKAALEA